MSSQSTRSLLLLISFSLLALTACGDGNANNTGNSNNTETTPQGKQVTIKFNVLAGHGYNATCSGIYHHMGANANNDDSITINDLRFFVSNVELKTPKGWEKLTYKDGDNNNFQRDGVVLLDFEDKQNGCSNGTSETNKNIVGYISDDSVSAIRFTVGVPPHLNHQDQAKGKGIFAVSGMYWNWAGGYKYARIELSKQPQGAPSTDIKDVVFHLGEAGCSGSNNSGFTCTNSNRPTIELSDYNFSKIVTLDLHELFHNVPIDASGNCMSASPERNTIQKCHPYFEKLGLNDNGTVKTEQNAQSAFKLMDTYGQDPTTQPEGGEHHHGHGDGHDHNHNHGNGHDHGHHH